MADELTSPSNGTQHELDPIEQAKQLARAEREITDLRHRSPC